MSKQVICDRLHLEAIAPNAVRAIEETSDPELPYLLQLHYLAELRENNLAVLIHLRLEQAEILPVINCLVAK
jgi:hypothetical protein